MYENFVPGSKITLWCDQHKQDDDSTEMEEQVSSSHKKRKQSDRVDIDEEMDEIFHTLKKEPRYGSSKAMALG